MKQRAPTTLICEIALYMIIVQTRSLTLQCSRFNFSVINNSLNNACHPSLRFYSLNKVKFTLTSSNLHSSMLLACDSVYCFISKCDTINALLLLCHGRCEDLMVSMYSLRSYRLIPHTYRIASLYMEMVVLYLKFFKDFIKIQSL